MYYSGKPFAPILLLFFLSGVSGLIYEIIWLRELGLLFGNANYAIATTLAAFFLGLALGNKIFGNVVSFSNQPLKLYGLLEIGVAVCAVSYFVIRSIYAAAYPLIFEWFGSDRQIFTAVKFGLALIMLLPPTFLMGGTLPVISHFSVDTQHPLGLTVSLLYFINTLGAVAGALLAGIFLPPLLGFTGTYIVALALTFSIALIALILSRQQKNTPSEKQATETNLRRSTPDILLLRTIAMLSGLVMLGLQVLWNRMFAQVLQNSIYTFSLILVVFLVFMAIGSGLANRLIHRFNNDRLILFWLLTLGGSLVATTPFTFLAWTDDLMMLVTDQGWSDYLWRVSRLIVLVIGPPVLLLGGVFPLLIKLGDTQKIATGQWVGELTSSNTLGAIIGSLMAGFIILDSIGLWAGIRLMAVLILMTAGLIITRTPAQVSRLMMIPSLSILLSISILDTSKLPIVQIDPINEEESLLQAWEGSAANVAVIRQQDELKLKVNNHYTLGGSGSFELEQFEGYLPLLLHRNPKAIYCLGLGTGITAGATLDYPIQQLIVTEIIPDVISAADQYFYRYTNRLFYDKRVSVIHEDGRNYLRGTNNLFDVIIGDLFIPWKAGVGGLYSLEHYLSVKQRLQSDGIFMQWLPAYQLSTKEFNIIASTLLAVFPQVTVWRGDFSPSKPVIGLLGHSTNQPLASNALLFKDTQHHNPKQPILSHYLGQLNTELSKSPLNTDNHPIIEFQSPKTQLLRKAGSMHWMIGETLLEFMQQMIQPSKLSADSYLSQLNRADKNLPLAGFYLHQSQIYQSQGKLKAAATSYNRYQLLLNKKKNPLSNKH